MQNYIFYLNYFCGIIFTAEMILQEGALNKKIVFYNLWWLLALPTLVVCLCTAITSFLTLNYEYLPKETDFLSGIFYDLADAALSVGLGLCLGALCYALYKRKTLFALLTAFITLAEAALLPMAMFFVRSVFLASVTPAGIMEEYFSADVYLSLANLMKMLAGIIIALIVTAVFFFGKIEKPFGKPYLVPKSEPAVCALIMTLANLVFITVMFTFAEEYDFLSLAFQVVYAVIAYFVIVLGVYMAQRKCGNQGLECENSTKSIDK